MFSRAVRLLPPRGSGETAVLKGAVSLHPPIAEERWLPRGPEANCRKKATGECLR